ncbi:hypothetical protein SARC_12537 [Sphaeroforma arctica JP610]|uniref:Arrestin C-terminal-like domain-containing protein n=1 Tax=Sphaeroforma arctica JP610 TaxID=667725 RepID=A0A0L0FDS4_9EUKA|nr:hypothetical protein SARC_12537 [Sphaeroforma arctica JP610]KNC74927.1 hypothetical protein SARC_12537 [Sphaeroforma arctica JP610]|eukprot:XP_014148829.1 hypothetical protein SARC_12537 [Sphaeroforma arctica JP610]
MVGMVNMDSYHPEVDNRKILCPENLEDLIAKFSSNSMSFKVAVDKESYNANDCVNGEVTINSDQARELPIVKVALCCRMRWHYGDASSIYTIYRESKTLAQNHRIEQGPNTIPFAFTLPTEVLSSLEHNLINVSWDARLLSCESSCNMGAVAYTRFQVSSLYRSNSVAPRTLGEISAYMKNTVAVRAEASLQEDVHVTGEPIHCNIELLKLHANTKVRRVKATLKQQVTSQFLTDQMDRTSVIDTATIVHVSRMPSWEPVAKDNKALSINLDVVLLADIPKKLKSSVAVQKHARDGLHLTPTTCVFGTADSPALSVSYSIEVCIETSTGADLKLSVPFTLQGSIDKTPRPVVEKLEDCFKTLALTDDSPPIYEDFVRESESTVSPKYYAPVDTNTDSCGSDEFDDDKTLHSRTTFPIPGMGSPQFLKKLMSYSRSKPRRKKLPRTSVWPLMQTS